ncbi:MAG: type I glyceraldehyde-3-phosphate dehydrogenase, partial [Patescibacteria group bacterium]
DQNLMDNDHKDFRRSRAAALNMLLTSTGAAKAIGLVIPDLDKKLNGVAIRVPTPVVSLVDLTVDLKKPATAEEINAAFKAAEAGPMKGFLGTTDLPLSSMDFKGDSRSAIVDLNETQVMEGKMAKIFAWYDNEWGYSMRCLDLAAYIASKV